MFLFILESLGTSELILIGILALVLLGPRKLPEIARKAGKLMAEFRGTAAEFKETWSREVNFEEEAKAFKDINFDDEVNALKLDEPDPEPAPVLVEEVGRETETTAPLISEADPARFEGLVPKSEKERAEDLPLEMDKKNWL